jgi:hypothetical protein
VSVGLDSWAVVAWLKDAEPAAGGIDEVIDTNPVVSWFNLVEVYYRLERMQGRQAADETLADLRTKVTADLPGSAHGLTLLTGDPEILSLSDPRCEIEDLRA